MTDVLIKRELLERVVKADASIGWKAMAQIRAILARPKQGVIEDSVQWPATPGLSAANKEVDDLATLVRRLVQQLRKAAPDNDIADKALDYLRRIGKQGNPLRFDQSATQQGEAVEVVGMRIRTDGFGSYIADFAMGVPAAMPGEVREPLMTVAQHQRILADMRQQLAERASSLSELTP